MRNGIVNAFCRVEVIIDWVRGVHRRSSVRAGPIVLSHMTNRANQPQSGVVASIDMLDDTISPLLKKPTRAEPNI